MPIAHILLIMVDGLGLPPGSLADSIYADCPHLLALLADHCVPLDAGLGVPGLPQSATGQTTLLTGVNAARALGHHLHGFPNADLRAIIEAQNLFAKLLAAGRSCTFANAYASKPDRYRAAAVKSVTTVATLAAFGKTRTGAELLAGEAVYHDLTRAWLREHTDFAAPLIDEPTAADHLLAILRQVDFCLFEYFLTDLAGHRGTLAEQLAVLHSLDTFLGRLLDQLDPQRELLLLTSDHGNIERPGQKLHSDNPVPFCACGAGAAEARAAMVDLADVTPRIVDLLSPAGQPGKKNPAADLHVATGC